MRLGVEGDEVPLERALPPPAGLELVPEAGDLGVGVPLSVLVRLVLEADGRAGRAVVAGLLVGVVDLEEPECLAHLGGVVLAEELEDLAVEPRALLLEDDLPYLGFERRLALPLELERLGCLGTAPLTCDRVAIHAPRIIAPVAAPSSSPGAVLAGAAAAQAAVALVNFGLPAIGPELQADYGLTLFALGAVLGAGLLGSGLALVAAGIAVDRFGSRRALVAGTALGAGGLAVAAFAPTGPTLFLALAVSGVGSAVVPVAGAGALFEVYPPSRRGWALGVRQTAVPAGGMTSAIVYPSLHALGGPELTLVVSAAAVTVTGLAFAAVVPRERRVATARIARPFRTILAGLGMTRLLAIAACYIVVLQALLAYVVPAVRAAGETELTAAVAFFAVNAAAMISRIAWGHIADRQEGSRRVRTLVEVGIVATVGAVAFAAALHTGAVVIVAAAFAFGLGALGWNALVYVSAGERVDPALAARSVAVAATVVFVLSALVTPALGALADLAGWDALWLATAVAALVGTLLAAGLPAAKVAARGERHED